MPDPRPPSTAVLVKGYPRISETFIARELLGLQERGLKFLIVSLRHPTDKVRHDLHDRIEAPVIYLPEYLHSEPLRVLRALLSRAGRRALRSTLATWLRDLRRDPTRNRMRRFGQAVVLASELPSDVGHLHAHFLHTPTSVARYAALMRRLPFSISAHAKDVWTIPEWEKREKLEAARWTVTCTAINARHLRDVAPTADVEVLYHGVDGARFSQKSVPSRAPSGTVTIASIARCVPKKGLDILLRALALLPPSLDWRHEHVGSGPQQRVLADLARTLGIEQRVNWRGTLRQLDVVPVLAGADLFCLPSRVAADGDRDGLPNVLLEAMCMELPVVTTRVSAIPELVCDGENGLLVEPDDVPALARALECLIVDRDLRQRLGHSGRARVLRDFSEIAGLDRLAARFGLSPGMERAA